ncbi:TPA: hypothetical protein ACGFAK_004616 [Serratia marcescens]|jgi:hypothetical protein|uniref:hypothetical protein n=1 Tax=Serratia TaxID=613 RepID=UPI00101F6A6D|nr:MULTISPECIES: hypothetical protein [Serratia]MBP1133524.1 hypothetical protein [Serratia sp. PL17]RYM67352.1 hypothetical protein BSQ99_24615 [Serratia liquefaciens]CAE7798477.1 hypothetical protein AI2795V1_4746 [Serratia marcescens]CAH3932902.1 hypothetical protein AI2795V1_4746 [Serratia marcescens]HBL7241663.1 hypothetical protein [Serratia liquefaciens]
MNEIDSLLRVTGEGVTIKLGDVEAMEARIEDWLHTPEGSVYGLPEYGNPLARFKHEPLDSVHTLVAIENEIIIKMMSDIADLKLEGIRIEPAEIDVFVLTIGIPNQELTWAMKKE